jgi:hypothetical protein
MMGGGEPTDGAQFPRLARQKSWRSRFTDVTVSIVLPWVVFFLEVCLFMYAYQDSQVLVYVLVALCAAFSVIFVVLGVGGRNATFLAIGLMCLTSVVVGIAVGVWLDSNYMARYWQLERGREVTDINPDGSADQVQADTGVVSFASNTFVDDRRTLGYISQGSIYCVAPVVRRDNLTSSVRFWAVGEGCCERRSNFDCGAARDPDQAAWMRALVAEPQAVYRRAILAAGAVYGINSTGSATPRILNVVADPQAAIGEIWDEGLTIALIAMIVDLGLNTLGAVVICRILAPKHTKQEAQLLRMI